MSNNWIKTTLKEICIKITDGAHKSPKSVIMGLPMASVKDMTPHGLDISTCRFIAEEDYYKLVAQDCRPKIGDVLIAKDGNSALDTVCEIKEEMEVVLLSSIAILRPDPQLITSAFLRYYLDSSTTRSYLKGGFITGAAIPRVILKDFKRAEIHLPPLPTQRKIAGILSAYDDLIENNTRRIKILEEMAQRIYREWFVDFRYPGHENDKLVESELGMIPEGWFQKYSDMVDFKEGPGLRNWQYRDKGIPFLNIRTLVNNDVDFTKVKYLDPEEVEKRYQHFLLQPNDHVVSSSGTLGRLVTIQSFHLPLMLNTSIIRMRPKTNQIGKWQLKHFLISDYFQYQINAHAIGSAQPNYGPSHLKAMWIIAPNVEIGTKYEETVSPIEENIKMLVRKNRNLLQTRDLLLPKLISGKVDVSELEIDMGAEA